MFCICSYLPREAAGGGPAAERSEERLVEGAGQRRRMQTRTLLTSRARALRKEMSPPEVMLWSRLRGRGPNRPTFRRQPPIGSLILDFYCPSARLAVEVDGSTHWDEDARQRDQARDKWLQSQDVAVLRIPASAIYRDVAAVTDSILLRVDELRRR